MEKGFTEGYDVEVVSNDNPDMYCMVCLKLMRKPVQFFCTHGSCQSCYENIIRSSTLEKPVLCPTCRSEIACSKVFPNEMVHRMILGVNVKCVNTRSGCEWIGTLGNLQEHCNASCMFTIVQCPCKNCDFKVVRANLLNHQETCKFRLVVCSYCNVNYFLKDEENHFNDCTEKPVSCPNKCGENIGKHELRLHLENCKHKEMLCPYKICGCEHKVSGKDMESHLADSVHYHLSLATTSMLQNKNHMQTELKEFKHTMQKRFQVLEHKIDEISTELTASQPPSKDLNEAMVNTLLGKCFAYLDCDAPLTELIEEFNSDMKTSRNEFQEIAERDVSFIHFREMKKKSKESFECFLKEIKSYQESFEDFWSSDKLADVSILQEKDLHALKSYAKSYFDDLNEKCGNELKKFKDTFKKKDWGIEYEKVFKEITGKILTADIHNDVTLWRVDKKTLSTVGHAERFVKKNSQNEEDCLLVTKQESSLEIKYRFWSSSPYAKATFQLLNQKEPMVYMPKCVKYMEKERKKMNGGILHNVIAEFPSLGCLPSQVYCGGSFYLRTEKTFK
ncbi:TNF receptor-associated factor 3-like [Hydractinia symbiolongicarpus]|uniref:TNF receptor-associated factor 3-like n=1 Tax=Hydractinia symbiolongicarpus TaxID=13093 RepID=UPI00254FD05F|nr:TNF receptor-associated factor 3-like [Hydractinia symbiolongicarpus]